MGVVLAGGSARGAYEVGVLQHIQEDVARDLGYDPPLDILCGTSVGAINVCALAAHADDPRGRLQRLYQRWTQLSVGEILQPSGGELFAMLRSIVGRGDPLTPHRGGVFRPAGLSHLLRTEVPFHRIDDHLRSGCLRAVTVSTTQVATGRTVVFAQHGQTHPAPGDPTLSYRAVRLRPEHALASAAIPILFPAVRIDGELHCDGGLRQNVPLSPARRLGADRLLVVNPHYLPPPGAAVSGSGSAPSPSLTESGSINEQSFVDPLFVLGKALNALLLDRIDNDIDRLHRINDILDAGTRRYGPDFVDELNRELARARGTPPPSPSIDPPRGGGIRRIQALLVRSSRDIGCLSLDFARSPTFRRRLRETGQSRLVARLIRHLSDGPEPVAGAGNAESDFLSYLLFDGEFARLLIEMGRADARAQHDALCALLATPSP